ncbi:helix-turn-helix domain-containing protein [Pontibacter rugosus]|uniref:Type II toxin-antitoxin system HigA family antitoxin n=1 Tax=Pontibacter rugosus TaxID=1745966 RepID=A0ABW3SRC6_9BACT
MEISIIENEEQYQAYLARVDELFEAPQDSLEAKELELLVLLVNKYEEEHYPISTPDPIDFIKVRMEDLGLKDKDMVPYLGDKAIVSKILNRKRKLSIDMIRRLHNGLRFPLDVLVQDYEVAEPKGLNATVGRSYRNIKRLPNLRDTAKLRHGSHS